VARKRGRRSARPDTEKLQAETRAYIEQHRGNADVDWEKILSPRIVLDRLWPPAGYSPPPSLRMVACLQVDLEPDPSKPGSCRSLIVWLHPDGSSWPTRPIDRGKKIVDVEPGDWIVNRGRRFQVKAVTPYRSHDVPDGYVAGPDEFVTDKHWPSETEAHARP
jgi:hypothetical protein